MERPISDGLQSTATRLGTSSDKAETASYAVNLLDDAQLEAAFRTSWAIKKAVMIPAFDAVRKWREWDVGISDKAEQIEAQFRVRAKTLEATWKARLYGGAGMLIGLSDRELDAPIELDRVGPGDLRYLTVLTRKEITVGDMEDDPREERYGRPRFFEIRTNTGEVLRVDPSRLVEFHGDDLPSPFTSGSAVYGWSDSILLAIYKACRNLDATMANIASLIFDAKTDIIKMPDFMANIVDPAFEEAVIKRVAASRMIKGNHGVMLLDAEDEYETKSYTFSGLDNVADRFMVVAAGSADIPLTRFLGQSPGGLNSTGEGDLANYYDKVQALQTIEMQPEMNVLDEVIVRSAGGGSLMESPYEWRPLRQMTEAQRSEIRSRDADTISKLAMSGVLPDEEVTKAAAQMFGETGIDAFSGKSENDADDGEDDEANSGGNDQSESEDE